MEQKIFLLIAIFCIALVKSNEEKSDDEYNYGDYTEYSKPVYPVETGFPYPGDFPKAVLLADAISLWCENNSKRECFQEKYSNGSDYYKHAIEDFSQQLVDTAKQTLDKVKEELGAKPDFATLSQNISTSANELGNLLKEYEVKFSKLVEKGSAEELKTLMEEYNDKIDKVEKILDEEIRELKGKTTTGTESNIIVKNLENTRNSNLTVLTDAGKQVMELLKLCVNEK